MEIGPISEHLNLCLASKRSSSPFHPSSFIIPPFFQNRLLKRLALSVVVLCGVLVVLFLARAPILRSAANLWIVDEAVTEADAVVVLGGGLQNRPFAAAGLYHAGRAPKILLMRVKPSPTTELRLTPTEQELTRKMLLSQGVPETDLIEIGNNVASSRDEAVAVADWVARTGAKRILIPTDPFHTHRVHWLYEKVLRARGVEVIVTAAPRREYSADDWWQHEEGLIDFQNEIIKYLLYRVKY